MTKAIFLGLMAVATVTATTPASAVITTFATFSATSSARNVRWVNDGAPRTTSATTTSSGTGGYFYTTATGTATTPGAVIVNFQFLQPVLNALGTISADFFLDITAPGTPTATIGGIKLQGVPTGNFSFINRQALLVNNTFYAAGSNLLSGSFTGGAIAGAGTSGAFSGNSTAGTLVYTSDFLDFSNSVSQDFAMSLTSITPALFSNAGKALRTFRATAGGSFSADPAPLVSAVVPEPAVWGLMVLGFGMIGGQLRHRTRRPTVAA